MSANASAMNNISYSFLAEGIEPISKQNLDPTEDVEVVIMGQEEVFALLEQGEFMQSLMVAPLWKYFYTKNISLKE